MIKSLWPPSLPSTLLRSSSPSSSPLSSPFTKTKRHVERRIVKTDPLHLYRIILDVDSYSEFLPLCTSSKILRKSDCRRQFDASLGVGLPPLFEETYVSRVTHDTGAALDEVAGGERGENATTLRVWRVDARSVRSELFDSLSSSWRLREVVIHPTTANQDAESISSSSPFLPSGAANGGVNGEEVVDPTTTTSSRRRWTDVDFEVEMTVSDPIVSSALDRVLEEVAGRQVEAFERRCREVPFHRRG